MAESDGIALLRTIPDATIARLPLYLRTLTTLADAGHDTVSSQALAEAAGVNPAQLRKDLSHLGSYGVRGVGYDVAHLQASIGAQIGSAQEWPVVIVGMGNLGTALARYSGYAVRGFRVVALVDVASDLIGQQVQLATTSLEISPESALESVLARFPAAMVVLTTPVEVAQQVCDRVVAAGVRSILSFAPVLLQVPDGVVLRTVDLGRELQILAYHQSRHAEIGGDDRKEIW